MSGAIRAGKQRKIKLEMTKMAKLIAIKDLAHDLGLPDAEVERWVSKEGIKILPDFRGRPAVDVDMKRKFSERPDYSLALKKSIASDRHLKNMSTSQAENYKIRRLALIKKYQVLIDELQEMHKEYMDVANKHSEESAVRAAYLLFTKAISCLKMGCDNFSAGYWVAGSVIREIDETIHLAEYFILTKDSDQGKSDLNKWFRQNYAPSHSKCREALSVAMSSSMNEIDKEDHRLLMNEIYQKKSKWVHPTFGVIREVTEFDVGDSINIKSMPYGVTNHEIKLYELTEFYKSSIWSAIQSFTICFSKTLPLSESTRVRLIEIDELFKAWN